MMPPTGLRMPLTEEQIKEATNKLHTMLNKSKERIYPPYYCEAKIREWIMVGMVLGEVLGDAFPISIPDRK